MASHAQMSMARHDSPTPADLAFAEFRRTGSADALGRVFDATAPSLLLLVAHFTDDAAMAEDLVQVTFLQAMESAHGFDESRPILPWLMSIVADITPAVR